jgi:vancomycin resistance protein YoaR
LKKGFHVIKLNGRTLFLLSFFISVSLLGSWVDKIERHYTGAKEGVHIENIEVSRMLLGELREIVAEMAIHRQKLAVEPSLDKASGAIFDGQQGIIVEIDETVANILAAEENTTVKLVLHPVQPRYNKASLEQARYCIGSYKTGFHGSGARYKNILMACNSLNNTIVWPGQEFSFNETTGPRTAERGYLPAPIIIGGGFDVGFGGGVCQVSSTLYNAILQARLRITERHAHSQPIHYVPEGKDATVSYGDQDLRFINQRAGPIIVKTQLVRGMVCAEIWGGEN